MVSMADKDAVTVTSRMKNLYLLPLASLQDEMKANTLTHDEFKCPTSAISYFRSCCSRGRRGDVQ